MSFPRRFPRVPEALCCPHRTLCFAVLREACLPCPALWGQGLHLTMPHPQAFRQVAGLDQSLLLRIGDETVAGTEGPPVRHSDHSRKILISLGLKSLSAQRENESQFITSPWWLCWRKRELQPALGCRRASPYGLWNSARGGISQAEERLGLRSMGAEALGGCSRDGFSPHLGLELGF